MLYLHLLLACVVAALWASLEPVYWLLAFAALYPLFRLVGLVNRASRLYALRVEAGLMFVPWFTWQVFSASVDVAKIVLSPRCRVEPAVVSVSIQTRDKRLITLIGCLLTLTPGTLALDFSARSGQMFVHVLDARSAEAISIAVAAIERRLMRWVDPLGGRL